MSGPPLSYQASEASQPHVSTSLPVEVVTCLKNARFLHLATADPSAIPNVSLMNYTYLPSSPSTPYPAIIMTTNPHSKKTRNLTLNPRVSLLVHDWVSHRPPTRTHDPTREGSPPPAATRSSLATLLLQMNTSALSRISVTINGEARVVDAGSDEEKWFKEMHLANNSFEEGEDVALGRSETGGVGRFIEGEEVRVVVVQVRDGRIADWKGEVKDWVIGAGEVNGV